MESVVGKDAIDPASLGSEDQAGFDLGHPSSQPCLGLLAFMEWVLRTGNPVWSQGSEGFSLHMELADF